ncbi:MAG TPA: hypothetical protein VGE08_12120 [Steroidobacter sp.]|uniref:hypothetical protein n=1 Tax=Steroidobacter sp. TaxID=1978227 RepID=UPI002ED94C5D
MKKISSGATVFYKRLFPLLWFGFAGFVSVMALRDGLVQKGQWMFLVMPILVGLIGFVIMRQVLWDLVDEVHDGGDYLLIRKGDEQERVPLKNIMNVSATTHINPPRVTLRLVTPGKFGTEVTFTPARKTSFSFSTKNPIVDDLIVRVDRARRA